MKKNRMFSVQGTIICKGSNYTENYSNIEVNAPGLSWRDGVFTQEFLILSKEKIEKKGVDVIEFDALPKSMQRDLNKAIEPVVNDYTGEMMEFYFSGYFMRINLDKHPINTFENNIRCY